jgi:hypothetical protein
MIKRFLPLKLLIILTLSNCSTLDLRFSDLKACGFKPELEIFTCYMSRTGEIFYEGQMKYIDNIYYKDGDGVEYFNSGDLYLGEWKMGERHGQGSYVLPDKTICSSAWVNDRQIGIVSCIYKGEYAGHTREGLTDGAGLWLEKTIYTFPNGKKVEEYWDNGKLIQQKDA